MQARRSLPFVSFLFMLVLAGASTGARPISSIAYQASPPQLDPDCIRFDEPPAVANGEIAFVAFTSYLDAMNHAVAAWSPAQGFAIPFRELAPDDDAVPPRATLIYRDAVIPGSAFKGVTVTWSNAPSTITLNLATLPPAETTDPRERQMIFSVLAHETGHALGLGDVPAPGVTIRECANMLMKRSVDKGGGAFIEPQAGDVALYCLRWGGPICGKDTASSPPAVAADNESAIPPLFVLSDEPDSAIPYRFFVVTCAALPSSAITPDRVVAANLPPGCRRAPAGVLFDVQRDDETSYAMLTNGQGEFEVRLPDGIAADVAMHAGGEGQFPSLVGFQPVEPGFRISGDDPACNTDPERTCEAVYLLVE